MKRSAVWSPASTEGVSVFTFSVMLLLFRLKYVQNIIQPTRTCTAYTWLHGCVSNPRPVGHIWPSKSLFEWIKNMNKWLNLYSCNTWHFTQKTTHCPPAATAIHTNLQLDENLPKIHVLVCGYLVSEENPLHIHRGRLDSDGLHFSIRQEHWPLYHHVALFFLSSFLKYMYVLYNIHKYIHTHTYI